MKPLLIKGVPSLISDLSEYYKHSGKAQAIGEVLDKFQSLYDSGKLLSKPDNTEQDPAVQLWLYYFRSQHQMKTGNYEAALTLINQAIAHTPTVEELYSLKAKIF